jgi:hypothetical protein
MFLPISAICVITTITFILYGHFTEKTPPGSRQKAASSAHAVPILEEAEIAQLAKCFANAITEGEMNVRTGFSPLSRSVLVSHTQGIAGRWPTRIHAQE